MESKTRVTHELQTLLVCMAHWQLSGDCGMPRQGGHTGGHGIACYYPLSQIMVYRNFTNFPLFKNSGSLSKSVVNTKLVLWMIYFWRYQILSCFGGALHQHSGEVENKVKPGAWNRPVIETSEGPRPLSGKWRGIYGKS